MFSIWYTKNTFHMEEIAFYSISKVSLIPWIFFFNCLIFILSEHADLNGAISNFIRNKTFKWIPNNDYNKHLEYLR